MHCHACPGKWRNRVAEEYIGQIRKTPHSRLKQTQGLQLASHEGDTGESELRGRMRELGATRSEREGRAISVRHGAG